MPTISEKIVPVDIEDEMKGAYIEYRKSVTARSNNWKE